MEANNVQVITLTTTSSPESASSTSHILNTSASSLISANYSNNSGVLSQDSSSSFSASLGEDLSNECKRKKFKSSSEAPKMISKLKPLEEKLEERLYNVLCCAVCLELPLTTIYQCSKGHLICISCFHHLMADSKLKEDQATCASCRCVISRDTVYRNLAVEKAIRELPVSCQHCNRVLTRMQLTPHESEECEERPVSCYYNRIGCPWRGPSHEKINHEEACSHPNKNGQEVLQYIETIDKRLKGDKILLDKIINLMSTSERIHFQDSQFKPFRTDEYIHRLFFETSKFQAFEVTKSQLSSDYPNGYQFAIKARINDDQRDPTQSCERKMTYQLVLKSKISSSTKVHYFITSSPHDHDDAKLQTKTEIYSYEFSENNCETPYTLLPLISTGECNKLLSNRLNLKAYPTRVNAGECRVKNSEIASGNFTNKEIELIKILANHGPVATTADASLWQDYLGGIIQFNCANDVNHAVQIVGYNLETDVPYYIIRNTWGPSFGIDGYLHVAIGGNLCGLEERVSALNVEMI